MDLDDLYEEAYNTRWTFTGKAEFFNRQLKRNEVLTITTPIPVNGVSTAEALNHAKFFIRKNNKLPENTRLRLFDYSLKPVSRPVGHNTSVQTEPNVQQPASAVQLTMDSLFK
jgi:hypothetical protein